MSQTALFACSVAVYAGIPLLLAIRRTPFQLSLMYAHIAAVLTLGGFLGAVYVLPVWGHVLLAGQVSYGGFIFSTLVTVVVGRDVRVVRNIVLLTVIVDTLVYLVFRITHAALTGHPGPGAPRVDPAVFNQSLDVVVLGGVLIILELLALFGVLELAKRRLGPWPMAPVYVLAYVGILALDGVLFPAVVIRPPSGLGAMIGDSVTAKLVLAAAYVVPLVLLLALYPRLVRRFEATPLQLDQLVPLRRRVVLERLREKEAELDVRTEEAGRAAATVTRILDAASNTLLVATDREFRVTHFNTGAERLLGYSEADLLGRSLLDYEDPDEVARHAAALGVVPELPAVITAMVERGGRHQWSLRPRSGEPRVLAISFTEIRDGDRLIGYLCAGDDDTGRMRTEAALTEALRRELQSVARLEEADRFKDEVVSTISHELRTPIASIRGYGELLVDGDLGDVSPLQADALRKVLRNTARLSTLVDDLLQLDRAQSGALTLSRVPVDLSQVTRDAWDTVAQLAGGRELDLDLRTTDVPLPVLGDPDALERVVLNLGGNAVKFTPDGGAVTVSVERDSDHAVLTVADTGLGIAQEEQKQMLERFVRSSQAHRHAIPGTGLGLSVVDAIVTAHRGELEIDSSPGRGTIVTVRLPLHDSGAASPDGHPRSTDGPGHS